VNRAEIVAAFQALPAYRQHEALRVACGDALAVWERYRAGAEPLVYHDGVVGMRHVVDDTLPARALADIDAHLCGDKTDRERIDAEYSEPIVAMQDDDFDPPGPIAQAYYAIYNLHRTVHRAPATPDALVILGQVASALDVSMADWVVDWWTRVWDAWASRELAYAPSPMTAEVFDALGDLGQAIELAADDRLRAVLLALASRLDEARETAAGALRADVSDPAIAKFLDHNACALVPEAIAVDDDKFAAICGDRLCVRDRRTAKLLYAATYESSVLRFVRIAFSKVEVAGDRIDSIGAWASFWESDGKTHEQPGHRTIAAFMDDYLLADPAMIAALSIPEANVFVANERGDTVITTSYKGGWSEIVGGTAERAVIGARMVAGEATVLLVWRDRPATLHRS
jgi:hypothetical protein